MKKFGFATEDLNKALFDTISAGIPAGQAIEFLNASSKLAVGGVTDLRIATDGMTSVFNVYKEQCVAYERILGCEPTLIEKDEYFECVGKKTVKIWNLPSEDVEWSLYTDTFDFYFTSPPYFETEKYASDTEMVDKQSWSRYNSFESWKTEFFFSFRFIHEIFLRIYHIFNS
jgi:hypothetical protein